ncbi:RNA binding-protein [Aureococcus anophagefferens]|nr:RNA binding-protein [Aureococcus anophagefferens]
MSSFGLGETFAPAKSSGSASALFSGGGARRAPPRPRPPRRRRRRATTMPWTACWPGQKRRRPDDDGFVTATAELAARVNAAPKKAKAPAPAKPAAAAPKPKAPGRRRGASWRGRGPHGLRGQRAHGGHEEAAADLLQDLRRRRDGAGGRCRPASRSTTRTTLVKRVCAQKHLLSDAKRTMHAYVVFETADAAAEAARAANGAVWPGPARAPRRRAAAYVAGEAPGLGGHGAIDNVRVVRRKEDHLCIGVAYVMLRDKATLGAALELDGALYAERPAAKKRPLRVKTCGKRTKASLAPEERSQKPAKAAPSDRGAKRRLEKKALSASEPRGQGGAGAAPRPKGKAAAAPKPWQGKKAGDADAAKAKKATDAKKKKRKANPDAGKRFVGKKPKP